jgi:hypothetical protein
MELITGRKSLFILAAAACFAFVVAPPARAVLVTSSAGFNSPKVIDFSQFAATCAAFASFGSPACQGPVNVGAAVGEAVIFVGSPSGFNGASLFNGIFSVDTNGNWTSGRNGYVGNNNNGGANTGVSASFAFTMGVNDIGAFMNYSPVDGGSPVIEVLGATNNVLESADISLLAPISTPDATNDGAFRGFHHASADIFGIRFNNGFSVLDNLTFARVSEPSMFALIGLGLAVLELNRRKKA